MISNLSLKTALLSGWDTKSLMVIRYPCRGYGRLLVAEALPVTNEYI